MATYCTVRDVRVALSSNGSDDDETANDLPDWQVQDAINEAEGIINTYLLSRYRIITAEIEEPADLDNPNNGSTVVNLVAPAPIRGWTRSLAAWLATLTFRKSKDIEEDDPIRLRQRQIMDMLADVRDRKSDLVGIPPADADEVARFDVYAENLYEGRMFNLEDVGLGYDNHHVQRLEPRWGW